MPDKLITLDAYRDPSAWAWKLDAPGHWLLSVDKYAVASVTVNRGHAPEWRVFTRPDITGVGEIVGSVRDAEEARTAAEAAARDHWSRHPKKRAEVGCDAD